MTVDSANKLVLASVAEVGESVGSDDPLTSAAVEAGHGGEVSETRDRTVGEAGPDEFELTAATRAAETVPESASAMASWSAAINESTSACDLAACT